MLTGLYATIARFIWLFACCIFCVGCQTSGDDIIPVFVFELRTPRAQSPDPQTRIELAAASGSSATFLSACKRREEGDSDIYQRQFVLDDEPTSRRALIVSMDLPTQAVFSLSIPRKPKSRDFSAWQHPNYLANGDVGWAVIYNRKVDIVSTNIPAGFFELRYKVDMEDLGPGWNPSMRRKDSK